MSGYKEGEGVIRFKPIYFTSPLLAIEKDFQVLLIGDNNMVLFDQGNLAQPQDQLDIRIIPHGAHGRFCLTIPDGIFLTYPIETYDLIIRVNGRTIHFEANLQLEETPDE